MEIQLQKLILEPLQQVLEESNQPIVIIIDGLDECEGEDMQFNVLRLLGSVFQRPSVGGCNRVCFIITSRPEPWVQDEFTIEPLSSITRQIFLGQTSEANDDIRTFFRLGFTEIHDSPKHRLTMSSPGHRIASLTTSYIRLQASSSTQPQFSNLLVIPTTDRPTVFTSSPRCLFYHL